MTCTKGIQERDNNAAEFRADGVMNDETEEPAVQPDCVQGG